MLLLYFLHVEKTEKLRENATTYERLYADVPLAPSTIRGIVQEFLGAQIIRRIEREDSLSLNLTRNGRELCMQTFRSLLAANKSAVPVLLTLPALNSRNRRSAVTALETFQSIHLDKNTYILFGTDEKIVTHVFLGIFKPGQLFIQTLSANEKGIASWWFLTESGKQILKKREVVQSMVRQYSQQQRQYSPLSVRAQKSRARCLAELISAIKANTGFPEEYYPHELRLESFLHRIWSS